MILVARLGPSVRGCIVAGDLSVLNLVITKKGDKEIEGVTDKQNPRRLGPKRASKIMKLYDLQYGDDVRRFVIRREAKAGHMTASKEDRTQYYAIIAKRRQLAQLRKKAKEIRV